MTHSPNPASPHGAGDLRAALVDVLFEYDRNTCTHEDTHRGGGIWTICDACGSKWADDRGGFVPYEDPPKIAAARDLLARPHPATAPPERDVAALREKIQWAIDTLYEINLNNYDHDEVMRLNDASVEVTIGLQEGLHTHVLQPAPAGSGDAEGLRAYLQRQIEWSKQAFGTRSSAIGLTKHIEKECAEVRSNPTDLVEWADIIILALDGFWRHGGTPETIMPILLEKQAKNIAREWPVNENPDEPNEHDRSGEEAPPLPTREGAGLDREAVALVVEKVLVSKGLSHAFSFPTSETIADRILALQTPAPGVAEAVEALRQIAEHPEKYNDGTRSYAVSWAFWNVQNIARAALATIEAQGRGAGEILPPGWKLVPVEATSEMALAGWIDKEDVCPSEIYHAMLAAAPLPSAPTTPPSPAPDASKGA